jgi:hypothetical protein
MKRHIRIIAALCLSFSAAACVPCSWAAAQSGGEKCSLGLPAEAEVAFGKEGRFSAVLLCCWRVVVCETRGETRELVWDWDKSDGGVGFKEDFLVRDVDGDGSEEVAFQVSKASFCTVENEAVLYSPERRHVFLLKYDGDIRLRLSPSLKDNQKVRDWMIGYWRGRCGADLQKITITYDAEP